MKFSELGIDAPILKALTEAGYEAPTPIQEKAMPPVLAGRDLLGCAQTGTGKTAAFAVPILQRLSRSEARGLRALILTPTRELALQIYENMCQYARYLPCTAAVIFGGVSQIPQVEAIQRGADVLIATPGRLWDLMGQKLVSLERVECFVLDEADRMLDMGFINDVKRIVRCIPGNRQTLLFSATMPKEIAALADSLLQKPVRIAIAPAATPVERIEQKVYFAERAEKRDLLKAVLLERGLPQTLVFTRTKYGADRVARELNRAGISARSLHGDKSQGARQAALRDFKECRIAVLVATDIAARGLDISELPLVVNFELPNIPETYVHRIGRTGRAGQSGVALSFCDTSERPYLADIEKLTRQSIPSAEPPQLDPARAAELAANAPAARRRGGRTAENAAVQLPAVPEAPAPRARSARRRTAESAVQQPARPAAPQQPARSAAPQKGRNVRRAVEAAPPVVLEAPQRGRGPRRSSEPVIAAVPEAPAPRRRPRAPAQPLPGLPGKNPGRAGNHPAAAPSNLTKRRRPAGKGRPARDNGEDNTRVDIATPVNRSHISAETAARIRAKVEAKLAERACAQSGQNARRSAPPAGRKSRPAPRGRKLTRRQG